MPTYVVEAWYCREKPGWTEYDPEFRRIVLERVSWSKVQERAAAIMAGREPMWNEWPFERCEDTGEPITWGRRIPHRMGIYDARGRLRWSGSRPAPGKVEEVGWRDVRRAVADVAAEAA